MSDTTLKWPASKIRQTFVDFFCKQKEHVHVPSSPVFPYDDPTLLFTNAGMNQFKGIFLGQVDPRSEQAKWKRAANSQKCIRAGGKHNDLDDTGRDTYHHTYFEMLGNWSFGDYFQEEAIDWAWELLIKVFGLDPSRIYVTYFGGDAADKLPVDDNARKLWLKYLPAERILPFGRKENFWEMGDTGPCGPCSEIHYDRIGGRDASKFVNADRPDVIEIWNLVFMQFNREESGKLTELPNKHVDTGMGFERLTGVLQNVDSNYDTDVFQPIFKQIKILTNAPDYQRRVGADDVDGIDTAYRIVADHIRTLTFAVTDGAMPAPDGRGYVLRRILRRAVRVGREYLKAPDGFFHQLVDVVVENFGDAFPELKLDPAQVKRVIQTEEQLFTRTLNRGINKFKSLTRKMKEGDTLSGQDAFLLYGTFGFPLDLIQIMSQERKFQVDINAFHQHLRGEKDGTANAFHSKSNKFELSAASIAKLKEKNVSTTNDSAKYEDGEIVGKVVAIWQGSPEEGSWQESADGNCVVILDQSNFYAESGGQLFDTGVLEEVNDEFKFMVHTVQVSAGYVLHVGNVVGTVKVGASVNCSVNLERRRPIMANHTSTHMLNFAIRSIINPRSDQRGSIVSDDRFRFDYAATEAATRDQLNQVETFVNNLIKQAAPVYTKEIPTSQAKEIEGIRAIFTEAYPDPVRVVSIGADLNEVLKDKKNSGWNKFSIELCGGTHLKNTREAELFSIVSEEAVQQGVRRFEAVTGSQARLATENAARLSHVLSGLKALPIEKLPAAFQAFKTDFDSVKIPSHKRIDIRNELQEIEQKIKAAAKEKLAEKISSTSSVLESVLQNLKDHPTQHVVVLTLEVGDNNKILSDTAATLVADVKKALGRDVAVFLLSKDATSKKPKTLFVAIVPPSLIERGLKANEWVSSVAGAFGGKGGGSKTGDVAQGNAPDPNVVESATEKAKQFANEKLKQ